MQESSARIIDANLNRASEASRVIEDIVRFHISSSALAGEIRSVRHSIREAPAKLGVESASLFEARDTESDVLKARPRSERDGLLTVASANFKRLEEAFRVLEEVGPSAPDVFSKLRFRTYTLEKKVCRLLARRSREVLQGPCVCVIVTRDMVKDPLAFIRETVGGGAGMIQLREKSLPDKELREYAAEVHEITSEAGALLIVNDRADIARAVRADGVHVGQEDIHPGDARKIVGSDSVVGTSTHSREEIEAACGGGDADYIGFGPVFETKTKELSPAGIDALKRAVELSSVPVYAIGGISAENVGEVVKAGARCAAVCGSVAGATNPGGAVESILKELRGA